MSSRLLCSYRKSWLGATRHGALASDAALSGGLLHHVVHTILFPDQEGHGLIGFDLRRGLHKGAAVASNA